MAKIHDIRSQTKRTNSTRKLSQIKHIARHHSATTNGDFFAFWKTWNGVKGWGTGGYHEIILRDGSVQLCYDPEEITNGVANHNTGTYHICVVGNGSFTAAQEETFKERCLFNMERLNVPVERVLGHREFSGASTACPGIDMNMVRNSLRSGAVVPVSKPVDKGYLQQGDSGPAIGQLQKDLNTAGANPPLAIDNNFGVAMKNRVITFQKQNGLEADGIWGAASEGKMNAILSQLVKASSTKEEPKVSKPREVSASHASAWKWAEEQGYLNGERPGDSVTREQFATVLQRVVDDSDVLELSTTQREEYAAIFKVAREKGVFTSDAHEKSIVDGSMTKSRLAYLQLVISGAALNGGVRVK